MLFLAANGAPIDPHDKWLWGVLAIMTILAIGLIMILLLSIAWRRYNQRLNRPPRDNARDDTDIWREAAGRYHEEPDEDDDDDQRQLDR